EEYNNVKDKKRAAGAGVPEDTKAILENNAERMNKLLRELACISDALWDDALALLLPFAQTVQQEHRRAGWLAFDGMLRYARDLLRDHQDARRELKKKYEVLLVDEFQDTDPLQYEIVFFLAEENRGKAKDPYCARLKPGKLFIVGDPKQSIYRFRGADIEAYKKAVSTVVSNGGRVLNLTTNFRSPSGVLEPIHGIFSGWMGPASETEPEYEKVVPPEDGSKPERTKSAPCVELWHVRQEGSADEGREQEGQAIATWIAGHCGDGKEYDFRDVGLLLRSWNPINFYLRPFQERGIPFVMGGGKTFFERPEILDLLAILTCLSNPNNQVAFLAVLRSTIGGVDDRELARFAAAGGSFSFEAEGDPGPDFPGICRVTGMLKPLYAMGREAPADNVIDRIMADTPLIDVHAAAYEGSQRIMNLKKCRDMAHSLARQGMSLDRIIVWLTRQAEEGGGEMDHPLADEAVDAVRVLSIHKAKGLEFPVVFLGDIARRKGNQSDNTAQVRYIVLPDGSRSLAMGYTTGEGPRSRSMIWSKLREIEHGEAENKRLFYVAMTRAMKRLILVASFGKMPGNLPWLKALSRWGFDGADTEDRLIGDDRVQLTVNPLVSEEKAAAPPPASFEDLERAVWNMKDTLEGMKKYEKPEEEEVVLDPRRLHKIAVGSVVHRALERIDFCDPGAILRVISALAREEASGKPVDAEEVEEESRTILKEFTGSGLFKMLASAEILGREIPVIKQGTEDDPRASRSGRIDIIYRTPQGKTIVADFKTDEVGDNLDEAAGIYRDQLQFYTESVRKALDLPDPPAAEIIFVRKGQSFRL
ncbi:UvrD-helicase domain-containing protein, partial [Acidobacteriota bacterium]